MDLKKKTKSPKNVVPFFACIFLSFFWLIAPLGRLHVDGVALFSLLEAMRAMVISCTCLWCLCGAAGLGFGFPLPVFGLLALRAEWCLTCGRFSLS